MTSAPPKCIVLESVDHSSRLFVAIDSTGQPVRFAAAEDIAILTTAPSDAGNVSLFLETLLNSSFVPSVPDATFMPYI